MALLQTEGLVLRVRPFGEADKIVTILTSDQGKVEAVARGARRPRSRLLGSTQPFSHIKIMIFTGRSLHQLSQAEIVKSFAALRDDLLKMAYASYWSELVDGMVPADEKDPIIFDLLLQAYTILEHSEDPELLSRGVELKLLNFLGYLPELNHCVGCSRDIMEPLSFSSRAGGVVGDCCRGRYPEAQALSSTALKSMRFILEADLKAFPAFSASPSLRLEIRKLLRAFIEERVEVPLKSLSFLTGIEEMPV